MTEKKRILYRGVPMMEGWPDKIQAAQKLIAYTLDGKKTPRIRYGSEKDDWNAEKVPCHDCRVIKGEFHVPGCDVEECPHCRHQLISCDCAFEDESW
jgi:hypothetical protein